MNRLINYLMNEGFVETIKKIIVKIKQHGKSETIFFQKEVQNFEAPKSLNDIMKCVKLTEENQSDFENIKFWSFINTNTYLNNPNASILLLKIGNNYVGYAAEQHETERKIHGLGVFNLKRKEGWIGPVYVVRQYRGQGLNRILVNEQIMQLRQKHITTFFTSINSANTSSIKSFNSLGFKEFGRVGKNKIADNNKSNTLRKRFKHFTVKKS